MRERHTNRRPVSAVAVGADSLLAITLAAEEAGGWLRLIPRDRLVELGSATVYAQRAECADEAWRAEIAQWAGGNRPDGTGVPDSAIPQHPTQTTVPSRDFGQPGTLPVGAAHDLSATYAILHRRTDAPVDWLRAGQALSAAWQTATELGVSLWARRPKADDPQRRAFPIEVENVVHDRDCPSNSFTPFAHSDADRTGRYRYWPDASLSVFDTRTDTTLARLMTILFSPVSRLYRAWVKPGCAVRRARGRSFQAPRLRRRSPR
jgi:hypothetical protein